jgi:hypothetical protein
MTQKIANQFAEIGHLFKPESNKIISFYHAENGQSEIYWAKARKKAGEPFDPELAKKDVPAAETRAFWYYRLASALPQIDSYFQAFSSELHETALETSSHFYAKRVNQGLRSYRSFVETLAAFNDGVREIEKSLQGGAIGLLNTVSLITTQISIRHEPVEGPDFSSEDFSERSLDLKGTDLENFKSKNIMGQVRALKKTGYKSSTAAYQVLSEYAHPNFGVIWLRRDVGDPKIDSFGVVSRRISATSEESEYQKNGVFNNFPPLQMFINECEELCPKLHNNLKELRKKVQTHLRAEARKILPKIRDGLKKQDKCVCGSDRKAHLCCASVRFLSR